MKHIPLLLSAGALLLASCGTNKEQSNTSTSKMDTLSTVESTTVNKVTAQMSMKPIIQAGDAFELQFTVYTPPGSNHSANGKPLLSRQ